MGRHHSQQLSPLDNHLLWAIRMAAFHFQLLQWHHSTLDASSLLTNRMMCTSCSKG